MTVTQADITWAKGQCSDIRGWVLRGGPRAQNENLPGNQVLRAPPQIGSSRGEGRAGVWIAWFAALRGYYRGMMHYIAGSAPHVIDSFIASCPYENERIGMQQACHVFWSTVLRGRGEKIQRGRWLMSEIQLQILGDEDLNREFYSHVREQTERYVQQEQARYQQEHDSRMGPREQLGAVIARYTLWRRQREYGVRFIP